MDCLPLSCSTSEIVRWPGARARGGRRRRLLPLFHLRAVRWLAREGAWAPVRGQVTLADVADDDQGDE